MSDGPYREAVDGLPPETPQHLSPLQLAGGGALLAHADEGPVDPSRLRGVPTFVVVEILVIVVLAALAIALVAQDGDLDVRGGAVLELSARHTGDGSCSAVGVDSNVGAGAPVQVVGELGDVLATTALESGRTQADGSCYFPFAIADLPGGERVYGVRVAGRPAAPFDHDGLEEGPVLWLDNG